jgi:hypothetical protein
MFFFPHFFCHADESRHPVKGIIFLLDTGFRRYDGGDWIRLWLVRLLIRRTGDHRYPVKINCFYLDTGFRRYDGGDWIPAFAGMTEEISYRLSPV